MKKYDSCATNKEIAVKTKRENGIALITTLLILFLVSALVVGMSWMVMSDQRLGGNNQNRETAFYGAEAGMEKMTSDMGNVFATRGAITPADVITIAGGAPVIPGVQYQNAVGASTYQIGCPVFPCVNPVTQNATIQPPSPYAGMQGLITPFTLSVAAQTNMGSEVKLQRQVQLVAIPVFQFGIFSNTDLSFFAGPVFDFGGRVHTNGNLWLAANTGPLFLSDKVTVAGEVIRTNLENGFPIGAGGYGGTVNIGMIPGAVQGVPADWRALLLTEGSVNSPSTYGAVNTNQNNPSWTNAVTQYNGMLKNGVQPLNLVSTALGGLQTPVALIRRPLVGEQAGNSAQFSDRYYSQAALRIMLDDYGPGGTCANSDMMNLDTISAGAPIDLATLAYDSVSGFNYAAGNRPAAANWYTAGLPLPLSNGPTSSALPYNTYTAALPSDGYWQVKNTAVITGCIKIEYESAPLVWTDVTKEILNLGVTGRNIHPQNTGATNQLLFLPNTGTVASAESATCGGATSASEPSPNAVIRLTRLRDNPSSAYVGAMNACNTTTSGYDYWPMALYDTREAISRDAALANNPNDAGNGPEITTEGVMDYIELDVNNLSKWFTGAIAGSGISALNTGGYAVYFSDRRGNQIDPTAGVNIKTGSFGFNDIVNPDDPATGCPNTVLDGGEDFESDLTLRTYGGIPLIAPALPAAEATLAIQGLPSNLLANLAPTVLTKNPSANPHCAASAYPMPDYVYIHNQEARENPPAFFRHALKLEYGGSFSLGTLCYGPAPNPPCGLTIAAENPVYIQGDYNAPNNGTFTGNSVAASVAADAVTLLSDNWNDINSFISPYDPGSRPGIQTAYRVAIISGKGIPFAQTAGSAADYGTDGGLHNFLRYIENWGGSLFYEGSLVSFYYNRQAIGIYKCCTTVYSPPTRIYAFDANFTQGPQWLPPKTPTLRSINTIGFTQMLSPTQ